jgi:threonine dehydrogenase-like Zn-dependent dehydrogenase
LDYKGSTHAQYVSLPEKCVIKAPDDIDYDTLVMLGGDTVGVANRAANQLDLNPGKLVYISGAGPIGLGVSALLKHLGCRLAVSELSAYRRDYVTEHVGTDYVFDPATQDVKALLYEMTDGIGPEIVVECSGNPHAQLQALDFVRCGGTVMLCGENYDGLTIVPSYHIIHKEVTLKGAFYFTADDFLDIVALYRKGLDISGLISHRVPLDGAPEIIKQFVQGKTGKVILHPQE